MYQKGTKVRLIDSNEIGVVIHGWKNQMLDTNDYHIAFYGTDFPTGEPKSPAYVLRYSEVSVEEVE